MPEEAVAKPEPVGNISQRFVDAAVSTVYAFLDKEIGEQSKKQICGATSLPESLVAIALDELISENSVARRCVGRGTKYVRCNRRLGG